MNVMQALANAIGFDPGAARRKSALRESGGVRQFTSRFLPTGCHDPARDSQEHHVRRESIGEDLVLETCDKDGNDTRVRIPAWITRWFPRIGTYAQTCKALGTSHTKEAQLLTTTTTEIPLCQATEDDALATIGRTSWVNGSTHGEAFLACVLALLSVDYQRKMKEKLYNKLPVVEKSIFHTPAGVLLPMAALKRVRLPKGHKGNRKKDSVRQGDGYYGGVDASHSGSDRWVIYGTPSDASLPADTVIVDVLLVRLWCLIEYALCSIFIGWYLPGIWGILNCIGCVFDSSLNHVANTYVKVIVGEGSKLGEGWIYFIIWCFGPIIRICLSGPISLLFVCGTSFVGWRNLSKKDDSTRGIRVGQAVGINNYRTIGIIGGLAGGAAVHDVAEKPGIVCLVTLETKLVGQDDDAYGIVLSNERRTLRWDNKSLHLTLDLPASGEQLDGSMSLNVGTEKVLRKYFRSMPDAYYEIEPKTVKVGIQQRVCKVLIKNFDMLPPLTGGADDYEE